MAIYVALQLLYYLGNILSADSLSKIQWTHLKIWAALVADNRQIPLQEVIMALFLSVPISLLVAYLINYKHFSRFAKRLGVTEKYGDENLFSHYLNIKEIEWVYIRDIKTNLTYEGIVHAYSETDTMQEIMLREVNVYRYEDSKKLYSVPSIYLAKPAGEFVIEAVPQTLTGTGFDA